MIQFFVILQFFQVPRSNNLHKSGKTLNFVKIQRLTNHYYFENHANFILIFNSHKHLEL